MNAPAIKKRVVASWSSGKDSAWMLRELRDDPDVEVVALLTTLNEAAERVAMHAVRRALLEAQAEAAGLPLIPVLLPWPCSNEVYEERMLAALEEMKRSGADAVAFGDLFLEDIRDYRLQQMAGRGLEPLFPIWGRDTASLAREMVAAGVVAHLTCVDPRQLDPSFVGRRFDDALLDELPEGVDPCGENGEFHTFVSAGPMFARPIPVAIGERLERDGFWFADVVHAPTHP